MNATGTQHDTSAVDEPLALTFDARLALVAAAESSPASTRARNVAIVQLLLHTRLDAAALAELDVAEVDLEQHELWLSQQGEALAISDLVAEALEAHLADRGNVAADEQALFLSDRGRRMTASAIEALVIRLSAMASAFPSAPFTQPSPTAA